MWLYSIKYGYDEDKEGEITNNKKTQKIIIMYYY